MAYYLQNLNYGNIAVSLPSAITLSAVGDYVEFSGFAVSGNSSDEFRLIGQDSGYNNLLALSATSFVFVAGGANRASGAGYSQPALDTDFTARAEITGTGEWSYYLNGTPLTTVSLSNSFTFNQLMRFATAEGDTFKGGLYYVETGGAGGAVHRWDADASGGSGSVLPDTVGSADATLVGFPTDGTQWGGTTPSASLTITQTELTPGGTISGTYSNYATVPTTLTVSDGTNTITIASPTITDNGDGTGSFSGTMPALPTTGTANLVLFGDVTVELT